MYDAMGQHKMPLLHCLTAQNLRKNGIDSKSAVPFFGPVLRQEGIRMDTEAIRTVWDSRRRRGSSVEASSTAAASFGLLRTSASGQL